MQVLETHAQEIIFEMILVPKNNISYYDWT